MIASSLIKTPKLWYRKSTKEWVLYVVITTHSVQTSITFTNKKRSKVLKQFYKFCTSGILMEEMLYRFRHNEIHIEEVLNENQS